MHCVRVMAVYKRRHIYTVEQAKNGERACDSSDLNSIFLLFLLLLRFVIWIGARVCLYRLDATPVKPIKVYHVSRRCSLFYCVSAASSWPLPASPLMLFMTHIFGSSALQIFQSDSFVRRNNKRFSSSYLMPMPIRQCYRQATLEEENFTCWSL